MESQEFIRKESRDLKGYEYDSKVGLRGCFMRPLWQKLCGKQVTSRRQFLWGTRHYSEWSFQVSFFRHASGLSDDPPWYLLCYYYTFCMFATSFEWLLYLYDHDSIQWYYLNNHSKYFYKAQKNTNKMACKVFCAVLQVNTSYLIQQCFFFFLSLQWKMLIW